MSESESNRNTVLLDAWRDDGMPAPADARARVRARLALAIPEMQRNPSALGRAGGAPARLPSARGATLTRGALTMFVAGAVTGMTVYATWMTPTSRVVYVDRPAHTGADVAAGPTPVASIASATPADSRIAKEEASLAPSIARPLAPVSVAHKSPRSTSSRTSTLDAERRLLDDARASLIQGNPDRALSCLENYRKRYPQGILAEEADTMRVEALAGVGRPDDARRAAEEFSLRAPSIYAPTVESAISTSP